MTLQDYVPYTKQSSAVRKITKELDRLARTDTSEISDIQVLLTRLHNPSSGLRDSEYELFVLHLADFLAKSKRIDVGVEILYFVSQLYSKKRLPKRVAFMDLMIANYLLGYKRTSQAIPFLQSAKSYLSRDADPNADNLVEALLFLHRRELTHDLAQGADLE